MKFTHVNIIAKNYKKLADFYVTTLGCTPVLPERDLKGEWLDKATGIKGAHIKGIHLKLPGYGDDGPTLEIFTYEEMLETEALMANSYGFTHIAFEVPDVYQTLDQALGKGAQPLGKITEKEVPNVGMLQFVYFRDPEGNIVEIQSWK